MQKETIGECCYISICRHTNLLVISMWIGENVIYLFGLVTSAVLRCWGIHAALLLSGYGLGASTVYSWTVCSPVDI